MVTVWAVDEKSSLRHRGEGKAKGHSRGFKLRNGHGYYTVYSPRLRFGTRCVKEPEDYLVLPCTMGRQEWRAAT